MTAWRSDALAAQESVLGDGPTVVSATAPYGRGGLGRALLELVEALRRRNQLARYFSPEPSVADEGAAGIRVEVSNSVRLALRVPPMRFSAGQRIRIGDWAHDRATAGLLPPADRLITFNGHAERHFAAARALGYRSVGLLSATAHMDLVSRRHREAWRRHPIERPWSPSLVATSRREYATADEIFVLSRHSWESFVDAGVAADRLRLFPLTPEPSYVPAPRNVIPSTFDIVYVGSLAVHKGVPLLVDAVRRLPYSDVRLLLVGGWGSRGMRRYLTKAAEDDHRVQVVRGELLPILQGAGVYVHPSWSESFGYAPAEAWACGVPIVVTEDTGMKDLLVRGGTGFVVPTGDIDALVGAIDTVYRAG